MTHRSAGAKARGWAVALEQDTERAVTRGSVAALTRAVRRGADLRVFLDPGPYQETLYFQQTYAGENDDDSVAGIMSHHHAFKLDGKPTAQPYISLIKCDPSGNFAVLKWMLGDRTMDMAHLFPHSYGVYRWLVCDRWRLAYEHDADGNRVAGDLQGLRDAVARGHSVRVGVRQFFGMADDDDDDDDDASSGPAHVSYLTVTQPILEGDHVLASCDLAVVGAPRWPIVWADGVHVACAQPSTSGEVIAYVARPGQLPFRRLVPRRAMRWLVDDQA